MQYLLGTTTFRKENRVDKYANSVRVNKHEASSPRITMLCLKKRYRNAKQWILGNFSFPRDYLEVS